MDLFNLFHVGICKHAYFILIFEDFSDDASQGICRRLCFTKIVHMRIQDLDVQFSVSFNSDGWWEAFHHCRPSTNMVLLIHFHLDQYVKVIY
jgi:hypothetical protein